MKAFLIPAYYLSWHYTRALSHILNIYRNITFFCFNFFSIKILLRTIFTKFRFSKREQVAEKDQENIVVTVVMAVVGFIVRTATIVSGIFAFFLLFLLWMSLFTFWLILPLMSIFLFFSGLLSFFQ